MMMVAEFGSLGARAMSWEGILILSAFHTVTSILPLCRMDGTSQSIVPCTSDMLW